MLQLRDYQSGAIQQLRDGFAAGHRSQILVAPTGSGKTEIAIALLEAARKKGSRAAMILDRIVLCDQTSKRLDKYSIDHGVLQSGHWRYRPHELIQVCSAQTLEKRGSFPGLSILIVDEVHQQRKQTVEFIKANPNVRVIGLTATPFTKGLGQVYTNVVSPVTTKELVANGSLVPLKVFVAKEIDMTGAKKVAGEWSQAEAEERGMKITGDVVAEWIKKTHEVYGKPMKTIVFASGVNHAADLARQFAEQGYNFIAISYKDEDQYKRDVIEDFAKPDTEINGLIACDILTKGFDVADTHIAISARPFSKSLSSHVQQMGRVMRPHPSKTFALWLCLAKGSLVLTDVGLVPIDKVKLTHKIWDGINFVTHGGAVCNGIQEVITYQGLTATAGHLVHTAEGWRTFGDCASQQIRITQTGFGGKAIRLGDDLRPTSFLAGRAEKEISACVLRVCNLWIQKFNIFAKLTNRENKRVSGLQSAGFNISDVVIQQGAGDARSMLLPIFRSVPGVWRSWNRVQIFWSKAGNALDYGKSWVARFLVHSRSFSHSIGQNKSQWTLRTGKSAVAFCGIESTKQKGKSVSGTDAQIQDRSSGDSLFRQYVKGLFLGRHDSRGNSSEIQQAINQTKREVWDILDSGPHNRFTCEGLLVHNCHAGNYLRFREEWDTVFEDGVHTLDDGAEKTKKEKTEKEKEAAKCPKCGALWRGGDMCSHCGYVRERKSMVSSVPGELSELTGAMSRDNKQEFWSMMVYKKQFSGWSDGRAAHTYKDKFGVWPKGLSDTPKMPSIEVEKFIKSRMIAYLKSKKRGM